MDDTPLFNPLDKFNLGSSIVDALIRQPAQPLAGLELFKGAGVYALYYRGGFPAYARLAKQEANGDEVPIYVGKAIPLGGRKGGTSDASIKSYALALRLNEHAKTIAQTKNLKTADFFFRALAVDDIWISLGETLLIQRYVPLWNQSVEGFGNHDPGAGRYKGQRPIWDELHPGRKWAMKCLPAKLGEKEILARIENHFSRKS